MVRNKKLIGVTIICVALIIEVITVITSSYHRHILHQLKVFSAQKYLTKNITNTQKFLMRDDSKLKDFATKLYANDSKNGGIIMGSIAKIWPMPKYFSNGKFNLFVSYDEKNKTGFKLNISGGKYGDEKEILKDGFMRLMNVLTMNHDGSINEFSKLDQINFLRGINVVVHSANDELHYDVDESYYLAVPDPMNPSHALIEGLSNQQYNAESVYGALHALQSFSQLCRYDFNTGLIEIGLVPWIIIDEPRFPYRGLLIDSSRHYLPLPVIKKIIDSMTYTKLNVLHWHIVDSQSFPLEIPSYPKLWNGAYSTSERYTMKDAADIVSYAQRRGVHVLAEIDVPGHAGSWGTGYPSLWPSLNCTEPLDVSKEFTFQLIEGILTDLSKTFKYKFIHLGGDEVDTDCWQKTPHVKRWLESHKMNGSEAYQYFVLRTQKIALSLGYEIINWEETFLNFGDKLEPKTVVQNWLADGVVEAVTAAGLRCIMSNQFSSYLDHLDTSWDDFYVGKPLPNITNPEQMKLIIGGEVCMWGETIDTSDVEQTIWPRAAAAAERLWTPYDNLAEDPMLVAERLARFRCLLNKRGIAAAPLYAYGRSVPYGPGSCYDQ